jgi:MFS family permease
MTPRRARARPAVGAVRPALVAVAVSAAIAGVLYAVGGAMFGWRIPYLLYLVVILAIVAGRKIVARVAPPPVLESPIREDTDVRAYGVLDRPFAEVRRWEDRFELIHGDLAYFRRTVLPEITNVVDERLRTAHGLSRRRDPERAREILGPRLSEFLETGSVGQRTRAPSPAELSLIVKEMEDLWLRQH